MSEVRSLAVSEHQLIGDIIGDSFADDPINLWVFGSADPLAKFYTMEAKKCYLKLGFGLVMDDGSGGALWLPPGVSSNISLWRSLDMAALMFRSGGFGSIVRGMKVGETMAHRHPRQPHYYLHAIGAIQGKQGKGIGGQLMEASLQRVDADKMPAYLESSKERNVPFYRRFGFEVVEEITPAQGCPPMWLMWREAR